ncbi:MAG: protein kinase domain-containing protein, partial [Candidatus Promineifilaceae bacterium]
MIYGTVIGDRYEIEELLARGMAGPVYLGRDLVSGKHVAIKTLGAETVARDPGMLTRFRREAQALRELKHPNIVASLDLITHDDAHYMIMEYAEAGSLRVLLEQEPQLSVEQVLNIGLDIADALARSHRLGIIHRDLKPENVLLADDGTPRLSDFGVAHFVHRTSMAPPGSQAGTWSYMPPEAFMGQRPDERADIWSFGVLLFEMLAGRRPFQAETMAALIAAVLNRPIPDLRTLRPGLPEELYRLIELMLTKDYDQRIQSVRLVGAALEALKRGDVPVLPYPDFPEEQFSRPSSLPVQMTPLVGRNQELGLVIDWLQNVDCRLITLTGPGGVGKTRLALEIAHRVESNFQDGAFFVDLAPINDTELVASRIAQTLGIKIGTSKEQVAELADHLRGKEILIILDNMEQLIEAGPIVSGLLASVAGLKIIVTSRETLRLYGEREFRVGPLALPAEANGDALSTLKTAEAIELFVQRAEVANPDFRLTADNVRDVAQICIRLDGLPLALELAAARIRRFSPAYLLAQLDDTLGVLTGGPRDQASRHQTMRAAIDWSYQLLPAEEQALFARLAVFAGGWSFEATSDVCGQGLELDIFTGLDSLTDKSLLQQKEGIGGSPRFVMLETIHQYARERMAELPEEENLKRRHASFFAHLAERGGPELRGPHQAYWSDMLRQEYDNLRVALAWSLDGQEPALGLRMIGSLIEFWYYEGPVAEGKKWSKLALERLEEAPPPVRYSLLNGAGMLAFVLGEHDDGMEYNRAALELAKEMGDKEGQARALIWLSAHSTMNEELYLEGLVFAEKAVELYQELDDQDGLAWGYNQVGEMSRLLGYLDGARTSYEQAVAVCRSTGNQRREAISLVNLGYVSQHQGDFLASERFMREGMALLHQLKLRYHAAITLAMLAGPTVEKGDARRAARLLGASEVVFERMAVKLQPADQVEVDRSIELVRSALAPDEFKRYWDEGRDLSFEEAIAYAQV